MLTGTLEKITDSLSDLHAKILFGRFGEKEIETIMSYFGQTLKILHPDAELFYSDSLDKFKARASSSGSHCCLLLENPLERSDFPSLVNLAYGNKGITLIALSTSSASSLDYAKLTTMAGRYDSYYLSPCSFWPQREGEDLISSLLQGGSAHDRKQGSSAFLPYLPCASKIRKKEETANLLSVLLSHAGESLSLRRISSFSSSLVPNTVRRLLLECESRFLFYRLDEIELNSMKVRRSSFRLYPSDPSAYPFTRREAAEKADLLCLSPIIGKLKEEGYSIFYGYLRLRERRTGPKRAYYDEGVGLYARKGRREMILSLDVSGKGEGEKAIQKASPLLRRFLVQSGEEPPRQGSRGVFRVGIECLLSDDFDWEEQ